MTKILLTICTAWILNIGLTPQVSVDQARLAQRLQAGTDEQRLAAVREVLKIAPDERGPHLLPALLQELDRQREMIEARRVARLSGQAVPPAKDESEYLFSLLEVVSQSKDPIVLRPLIAFIGTGNRVINAVAAFGELALSEVLGIANGDSDDAAAAMVTLQRMLESSVGMSLSASSRQLIAKSAESRLAGGQKEYVLTAAIDLAVATRDPLLIQRIQTIATNESAVRTLGIADPLTIRRVQSRAAAALSRRR